MIMFIEKGEAVWRKGFAQGHHPSSGTSDHTLSLTHRSRLDLFCALLVEALVNPHGSVSSVSP